MKTVCFFLFFITLNCLALNNSSIQILKVKGIYATILNNNYTLNKEFYITSNGDIVGKCRIILIDNNIAIVKLDPSSKLSVFDMNNSLILTDDFKPGPTSSNKPTKGFLSLSLGAREISLNEIVDDLNLLKTINSNIDIDELNNNFSYSADFGFLNNRAYYFLTFDYLKDFYGSSFNGSVGYFYNENDLKIIDLVANIGVNFIISDNSNLILAIGLGQSYFSMNQKGQLKDYVSGETIQINSKFNKQSTIKKPFCILEFKITDNSKLSIKFGYRIVNFGKIKGTIFINGEKINEYALNSNAVPMNFDDSGFFGFLGVSFFIF